LVLLVLGDEISNIGLGLSDIHFVHALAAVSVVESLASEELVANMLEQLRDESAVTDEGRRSLKAGRLDAIERSYDAVGNLFEEVGGVHVLDVTNLIFDLLHKDCTTVYSGVSQLAAIAEVGTSHHVLQVENLLSELLRGDGTGAVSTSRNQERETDR
jgi:hypothetical protein